MEKELNWSKPTVNTLCAEEAKAFINNQEVSVKLVIRNEQSIKNVIINSCVRILIQTIIFIALLYLRKFF